MREHFFPKLKIKRKHGNYSDSTDGFGREAGSGGAGDTGEQGALWRGRGHTGVDGAETQGSFQRKRRIQAL